MRLTLEGMGTFAEIGRMVQAFFPDDEVEFAESLEDPADNVSSEWHIQAKVSEEELTVQAQVTLTRADQVWQAARTLSRSFGEPMGSSPKLKKRVLLLALHEVLKSATGQGLPWGVLFGVRPGKIVHERVRKRLAMDPQADRDLLIEEYGVRADRADLLVDVVERELRVFPDLYDLADAVSVYVGVPFCPTRCSYCTFPAYSMVEKAKYAEEFMTVLEREIRMVGERLKEHRIPVSMVYIGGGTPTSLKAAELAKLFALLQEALPDATSWREFSVEAGRADTITPDRVQVMREFGVNRVSVNPQSFIADTLQRVGRGHAPELVDQSFRLLREQGFMNINMDLIAGLPGETFANFQYSLERTLALSPDSVTVHSLAFKRGSAVTTVRHLAHIADDDVIAAMLDYAEAELQKAAYHPYYLYRQKDSLANRENIGYARIGKEGLYNIAIIEEVQSIVALGGGGASKWRDPQSGEISRQANPSEPRAYIEHIEQVLEKKRERIDWLAKRIGLH